MSSRTLSRFFPTIIVILVVLLVGGCSANAVKKSGDSEEDRSGMADRLRWAGFANVDGLEPIASDEERGLDQLVRFALRGAPADVERALTKAGFDEPFTPGAADWLTPLPGLDLTTLDSPRHAQDRWTNPSGQTLTRQLVRGGTRGGADLLHVWAFTT